MDLLPKWFYQRASVKVKDFEERSSIEAEEAPLLRQIGIPNNNCQCSSPIIYGDENTETKTTNPPVGSTTTSLPHAQSLDDSYTDGITTRVHPNNTVYHYCLAPSDHRYQQQQNEQLDKTDQQIHASKMVNRSIAPLSVFTVQDVNRQKDPDHDADFEKAIQLCGYGKYHYGFVLLCGMMCLCVGSQNGVNAYVLPSAECDLGLTSEQKGFVNVAFLLGGVFSAVFWGIFADAYGRKKILVGTLLADGILVVLSTFSQNYLALIIFRAINGFTIGAPGALIYTYLGEFHEAKHRVKSICYVGFFWTLSWLALPGLAWIVIPLNIKWHLGGYLYNSWRLYLALVGMPSILIASILMRYPESPKFLHSQGKCEEALEILRDIYASNSGRDRNDYPVKYLIPMEDNKECEKQQQNNHKENEIRRESLVIVDNFSDTCGGDDRHDSIKPSVVLNLIRNVYQQLRLLASPPIFKNSVLCCTIYFTNMFGYYGLGLWFPELFNRFETYYKMHPNVSVSVCELVASANTTISLEETISLGSPLNCDQMNIDERVFVNTLTINGVCLLGNVASGYFADRVGRRTIPVTTSLLAGIAGFAIYFVRSSSQNLIVACIYSLMITTANFVINSVVVDIFPTNIGAIAICMMTCFGRIGAIASNLAFGMLLDISCEVPIFLVGAIVVSGGLLALLLPPTKR